MAQLLLQQGGYFDVTLMLYTSENLDNIRLGNITSLVFFSALKKKLYYIYDQ